MKRIIICILIACAAWANSSAQTTTPKDTLALSPKDSLLFNYLDIYRSQLREPAYELYPTQNIWIFLKLNTMTGAVTLVQGGTDTSKMFEVDLDSNPKIYSWDEPICGRFKLYPTQNIYNFMMLDQIDGRVWQVQWGFEEKSRIVTRIY